MSYHRDRIIDGSGQTNISNLYLKFTFSNNIARLRLG